MKNEAVKEVFHELFSHLERLEAQTDAIMQLLKEKKRVTDKQLAPYLEQAAKSSDVRWRAARVRIDHLLSSTDTEEKNTAGKKVEDKIEKKPEIIDHKQIALDSEEKPDVAAANTVAPEKTADNVKKPEQKAAPDKTAHVAASDDKQATPVASTPATPTVNKPDAANDGKPAAPADPKPAAAQPVETKSESTGQESSTAPPESSTEKKPSDPRAA